MINLNSLKSFFTKLSFTYVFNDKKDKQLNFIWEKKKDMPLIDWNKAKVNSRKWQAVVWHHSLSADSNIRDTEAIKRYHMSYRIDGNSVTKEEFLRRIDNKDGKSFEYPWAQIGYHFLIEKVDGSYQVVLGRPLSMTGAHCTQQDMNKKAIGVCVIGNYDDNELNDEQKKIIFAFAKELNQQFGLKPENHHYHRDFADYKSCPGKKFIKLEELRKGML